MKLYRVVVDRVMYVLAQNEEEAKDFSLVEDPNPDEMDAKAELATKEGVEADHWENCPVYRGRGELACNAVQMNDA